MSDCPHKNLSDEKWEWRMTDPFIGNLTADPVRKGKPVFQCAACGHLAQVWDVHKELPSTIRCLVCGIVRRYIEARHAALRCSPVCIRAECEKRLDKIAAESRPEPGSKEFRALFQCTPVFVWFRRGG